MSSRFGRPRRSAAGAMVILAAALAGCEGDRNEFAAPPPPPVTVAQPEQRDVTPTRRFIGRVEASESVEIRARVRGFIRERQYEAGDLIEEGATLFLIEPEEYQARVNSAKASLERTTVAAELARITKERVARAAEAGAATDLEVLQSVAEHEDAKAAILEAQAALDAAQLDLDYTTVTAPISGRVAESEVDVGNLVGSTDATLLTKIVEDREVRVYFEVSERELLEYMRQSDIPRDGSARGSVPVSLILSDGTVFDQQGIIDYLDPQLDRATGTITLRASVENPNGMLVPGMVVRVEASKPAEAALLVPEAAVMRDMGGAFVFTVGTDNTVARATVELGDRFEDLIVVTAGLAPEDSVIVKGTQRAREGLVVAPTGAPAPSSDG